MRPSKRKENQLREVKITTNTNIHAEGSCIIEMGNTRVSCTATVEEKQPPFLRNTETGWVTAEYGMLPRATNERINREAKKGQSGRTQEIQRLIGRALRSVVDLEKLGKRQIIIDCDVLQADGGTRTASITGGFVAMYLACQKLMADRKILSLPLANFMAAVSCGIYKDTPVLDLDYPEDCDAETDANFVMADNGKIIEIQGTAEEHPFTREQMNEMLDLAEKGISELIAAQKKAIFGK